MNVLRVESTLNDQTQERGPQPQHQMLEKELNTSPRDPRSDILSKGNINIPDNHTCVHGYQPKDPRSKEKDIGASNSQSHCHNRPELFIYNIFPLIFIISGICYATFLWKYSLEPCLSARSIAHIGDNMQHKAPTLGRLLQCMVTNTSNKDLASPILWATLLYASIIHCIWFILQRRTIERELNTNFTQAQEKETRQQQRDKVGRESTITLSPIQGMVIHFFWPFHSFKVNVKKVSIFDPLPILFFVQFLSRSCFQLLYMEPCYQHLISSLQASSVNEDLHQAQAGILHGKTGRPSVSQCLGLFRGVVNSSPGDFIALATFYLACGTLFIFYLIFWYNEYKRQRSGQRDYTHAHDS